MTSDDLWAAGFHVETLKSYVVLIRRGRLACKRSPRRPCFPTGDVSSFDAAEFGALMTSDDL